MDTAECFTISKTDAAKRQLETAVRLFIHDRDPCSIHTLAAAAYNIVRDLRQSLGLSPLLLVKEIAVHHFGHDSKAEFNRTENYLKHADRDVNDELDIDPEQALLLIWDGARGLAELTGKWSPLLRVYDEWYRATHPNIVGQTWLGFIAQLFAADSNSPT